MAAATTISTLFLSSSAVKYKSNNTRYNYVPTSKQQRNCFANMSLSCQCSRRSFSFPLNKVKVSTPLGRRRGLISVPVGTGDHSGTDDSTGIWQQIFPLSAGDNSIGIWQQIFPLIIALMKTVAYTTIYMLLGGMLVLLFCKDNNVANEAILYVVKTSRVVSIALLVWNLQLHKWKLTNVLAEVIKVNVFDTHKSFDLNNFLSVGFFTFGMGALVLALALALNKFSVLLFQFCVSLICFVVFLWCFTKFYYK